MDDQDEADLGGQAGIDPVDAVERRLRQQANDDEEDPFENIDSFSGSDHAGSDAEPPAAEDEKELKMDLSDDEDAVIGLNVDDSSLSLLKKRVQAASGQPDAENDEFSAADPFENLTDSDAPVMHQPKTGEFDISSAIHSQAERDEFNINSLVEQFRAAQKAHEEVFGNVFSLHHIQAMFAPQIKVEIPKQLQIEFLKQSEGPVLNANESNFLDSYKAMLSSCVEQHLQTVTSAHRRRSFGTKRRLHSRTEDLDLSDAQSYVHSFLSVLMISYSELVAKTERNETRQWVESRMKSIEQCIAQMSSQIQAEISLDRDSRIDNTANLEGVIIGRLNQLEERLVQIEFPQNVPSKEKHRRQQSPSSISEFETRPAQYDAVTVQYLEKKNACDCSRLSSAFFHLCTVFLLFAILYVNAFPLLRSTSTFLS